MEKTKLNILPVPTFRSLGVNYAERTVSGYETESIDIKPDESREVIRFYDDSSSPCRRTEINIGGSGRLKLVQVFTAKQPTVSGLDAALADDSSFELVQLYIGGSDTVSEIAARLNGGRSQFRAEIGCALDNDDRLDINLIADHYGRKTASEIGIGSVLSGRSQKTFKGTVDFKNGASGAKGNESEEALLLGSRVRNRTVPVILCAEEDVEGSHGATVGRLDEQHIFYLSSRGLTEKRIYELAARAKLARAISRITDSDAVRRIYNILGWGDENG